MEDASIESNLVLSRSLFSPEKKDLPTEGSKNLGEPGGQSKGIHSKQSHRERDARRPEKVLRHLENPKLEWECSLGPF